MRTDRGFTLYEMLLAFAILGLLAAFAWTGFSELAVTASKRDQVAQRLTSIQLSLVQFERDILQADGRSVREGSHGSREPGFAGGGTPYALEFSRAGWRNPTGVVRPPTQRVAYALEGRELIRYTWAVLDRGPGTLPLRHVMLDQVERFDVALLDNGVWRTDWPPSGDGASSDRRPRAVKLGVTLTDMGTIERIVELIGDPP